MGQLYKQMRFFSSTLITITKNLMLFSQKKLTFRKKYSKYGILNRKYGHPDRH